LWETTVLVPRALANDLDEESLRGVLAHEFSHARTRDVCWNVVFELVCAVLWFHPAAWRIARIHEYSCEETCDAAAARAAGSYRQTLARMAVGNFRARHATGLAIAMARPAHIARRVRALTHPVNVFRMPWRDAATLSIVALAMLAALAGFNCYRHGPKGLYEKAPAATGTSYTLGPTRFTLEAATRWGKAGPATVVFDPGVLPDKMAPAADRSAEIPYMDIAEIRIGPDEDVFDIIELRVFDHATQKMLGTEERESARFLEGSTEHSRSSQDTEERESVGFLMDGHVARIIGLGTPLPDELDVWFRVRHRPNLGWTLKPEAGATTQIDGITVTVREVHKGTGSYSFTHGRGGAPGNLEWTDADSPSEAANVVVTFLDPQRKLRGRRFQLCVIDDRNQRHWSDPFLSVDHGPTDIHHFEIPPERIRSIELSPLYDFGRFYFEKVKLPKFDGRTLQPPPDLEFAVGGKEGEFTSDAFGLGVARLTTSAGKTFEGMHSDGDGRIWLTPARSNDDTGSTLMLTIDGVMIGKPSITLYDEAGESIEFSGSRSYVSSSGPRISLFAWHVSNPLTEIARVRITPTSSQEES
jgi:hypothetical protein